MGTRLELQTKLEEFMGNRNVYYQPPQQIKMQYPCIIYTLSKIQTEYANNKIYEHMKCYEITIVDQNKDSQLPDKFLTYLPLTSFSRPYPADGLWHFVFQVYF